MPKFIRLAALMLVRSGECLFLALLVNVVLGEVAVIMLRSSWIFLRIARTCLQECILYMWREC